MITKTVVTIATETEIPLGYQGENKVREIVFPQPAELLRETWTLFHRRQGDETPYPVPLEVGSSGLVWTVTSGDTANRGGGRAQLVCTGPDGEILKTAMYRTVVSASMMENSGEPPDPVVPWYDAIMDAIASGGGGGSGEPGADGGYYVPNVAQKSTDTMTVGYTSSKSGMPTVAPVTVTLPAGPQGERGLQGDPGKAGTDGKDGTHGKDGYTPVKGTDYWTAADKAEVEGFITDELADRAQLEPEFANSIEECTDTSKMYVLPDGDIYAYMMRETPGQGYTNLVPTSVDTDGSIYNGTGYKDGVRLSSSGGVSSNLQAGSATTGFMPWQSKGIARIKGATWLGNSAAQSGTHWYFCFFDASKGSLIAIPESGYSGGGNWPGVSITYDAESGITTFDFTATGTETSVGQAAATAAYIRINAKGNGADLIATVNEEIKEAEPTVEYQWASTGHAFVPADYEDRILALETVTAETSEKVEALEQEVSDIVSGATEIAAAAKFDPTVYGLPVLYLEGDISPIKESKSNKVTLTYQYGQRSGSCTLKGQGATSYQIAQSLGDKGKYNYTINFDTPFEAATGWGAQKKYCLKANWTDYTHCRNVCSCKIWGMIVKSRSTVPAELANLPNAGAVDGFPIVIVLNGDFHGLYTFNIPKDGWMFGLTEDPMKTQAFVGANNHSDATQFKGELAGDESDFELEFVSDEANVGWVTTSLNRLINACVDSDGSDLDTVVGQYIDWSSAIDYLIHCVVEKGTDCVDKNFLLVTFDGTKWYFSNYDRDSIYGLNWDGSGTTRPVSNISFTECANASRMWELITTYKKVALKARYQALRGNILSESRIMQVIENFAWAIPEPVKVEDVKLYPSIMGSAVNTVDQIGRFVRQRLETVDAWIAAL